MGIRCSGLHDAGHPGEAHTDGRVELAPTLPAPQNPHHKWPHADSEMRGPWSFDHHQHINRQGLGGAVNGRYIRQVQITQEI
ncbi:MAG: hypothetical protein R3B83_03735 [Nitrospirales bacterium]|nr:hypothetical protein [Nitrospirales bacterium]